MLAWSFRRVLIALAAAAGLASRVPAQALCDAALEPVPGSRGYQARGELCEGLYQSPSAGYLELISLLRGEPAYDLEPGTRVLVAAPVLAAVGMGEVHVRAQARPLRTYYQMDARLPAGGSLRWPVDNVLLPERLHAERIGVLGWVETDTGRLFVPLVVGQQGEPLPSGPLTLIIRSTATLESVQWRARPEDAVAVAPLPWQEVSDETPPGEAVMIRLPDEPIGVLSVEVAAKVRNGNWEKLILRVARDRP